MRVTGSDRPYGEFYDFYSVSPENFGYHLVRSLKSGKTDFKDFNIILSVKYFPVTMAWRLLMLWLEEQYPICMVAVNILNQQSRMVDNGW